MKKVIYIARLHKDGVERATAPLVAGFYGAYTGHKPGQFSFSYNVRESVLVPTTDMLLENLQRNLDPFYTPLENLLQEMLLEETLAFSDAVEII